MTPVALGGIEEEDQPEVLVQEIDEDPEADLPECPDHQPSSFLKGKP